MPWQRGSIKDKDDTTRDYCPKGPDLSAHIAEHVLAAENEINRERGWCWEPVSRRASSALLASQNSPCC
jgi:IS30 family transposase